MKQLVAGVSFTLAALLLAVLSTLTGQVEAQLEAVQPAGSRADTYSETVYLPDLYQSYARPPLQINEWQPALSPDGTKLVYVRQVNGGQADIYLKDLETGSVTNLSQTPDADEETPVFSPSGSSVAFASTRDGRWGIYEVDVASTFFTITAIAARPNSSEQHPAFIGGGKVAFTSDLDGEWDIYEVSRSGGDWTPMPFSVEEAYERFPASSPSGRWIAYRREITGSSDIMLYNTMMYTTTQLTDHPAFDGYPAIATDDSGIVFVSERSGIYQLYEAWLNGNVITLTSDADVLVNTPRISPDGRTLAYAARPVSNGTYAVQMVDYQSPLMRLASHEATKTLGLCDWTSGVDALGWAAAWHQWHEPVYAQMVQDWVDSCAVESYTISHVNDGLLGYAALTAYQYDPQPEYLAFADRMADYLMITATRATGGALFHIEDTVWDDTLISVVPFLVEMSAVTGDTQYLDEAVVQYRQHTEILQDNVTDLYYHAWREGTSTFLSSSYWARGNGWAITAAAYLLNRLPETHESYLDVRDTARAHAAALREYQDEETGLWHTVLDRDDFYLETSGSAAIGYGLSKAATDGWGFSIDGLVATRAFRGLWVEIDAEGKLHNVSGPTGPMESEDAYNAIPHEEAQLYGQGLGLLFLGTFDDYYVFE